MSIRKQIRKFFTPGLNKILSTAAKRGDKRFLVVWNRGLGDIALGLYAFVDRVRQYIPDASITFLTRSELKDAFSLLGGVEVIAVPSLERKDGTPDVPTTSNILAGMGINTETFDIILDKVDPKGELKDCWGRLIPRLKWRGEYDSLLKKFTMIEASRNYIGAHVSTETEQFYGYRKDWPADKWKELFEKLSKETDTKIILFGISKREPFDFPTVTDLRGETTLLEMLSIIKNRCGTLIAPDGGVLSIAYYLDVFFPITVISLWGEANQGIMKQAVPSPNKALIHIPIIGKDKDISKISVNEVLSKIKLN